MALCKIVLHAFQIHQFSVKDVELMPAQIE